VDGDTLRVMHPNGTEEKIRFIGINTPEQEILQGQKLNTLENKRLDM